MAKKLLALVISLVLIVSLVPMGMLTANAATTYYHLFPVKNGTLAYYYGYSSAYFNGSRFHEGIDIHSTSDDTIYAACGGTVDRATNLCGHVDAHGNQECENAGHYKTFGNYIRVKNDDGTYSYYGHLKQNSLLVSNGQRVEKGQPIATMGSSGDSTGKHLHYEVRVSGEKINTNPVANGGVISYSYTGYNGNIDSSYTYTDIGEGVYYIKNPASDGYLNLEYGKDENAANIHIHEFGDYTSQMFEITESTTTAGYKIRPIPSSTRLLNVYAEMSSLASGKNVCIYDDTGDGTQRWLFEECSDGYIIHCVGNENLVLDAPTWDVCVSTYSGADTQVWELIPVTHTVSYDANGGSGSPSSQTKVYGSNLIISSTMPTREGYAFLGWSTSSTATTAEYQPGSAFSSDKNTTLYAVWQSLTASTGIQSQLDKIVAVYPSGSYFTASGSAHKAGGSDCPDVCYECMLQQIPSRGGLPAGSSTNADTRRYQCYAFASYVSYIIFGDANVKNWQTVSVDNAKLGDVVYFSFNHWGIYLYTTGNKVVVYDGNYDYYCGVNYGSQYSISNVSKVYHAPNYDSIAHTHNYSSAVTKAPTCRTEGVETYICSCGASYTEIIPTTEHSYSEWIIDKEPTCTEQGHKYRTCSSCGGTNTSTIGMLGHDFSWIIDKNATCTDDGSKSYCCKQCNYKMDVTVIPSTGHSYVSTVIPATPDEQGYTIHTCSVCSDSYIDSYTDYVPTVYIEGNYSYVVYNGKATITKYNGSDANVAIPTTLGGYPVTAIGENAFANCSALITVSMPSVEVIGNGAFADCAILKRAYMPTVTTIGDGAFSGSDSVMIYAPLNSYAHEYAESNSISYFEADDFGNQGDYVYYVSNSEATIVDYNGNGGNITIPVTLGGYPVKNIGTKAFYGCTSLTSVTMPSVTNVGYSAFRNCTSLKTVSMPNVTTLAHQVFQSCSSLISVEIPNVEEIGDYVFKSCSSELTIYAPNNAYAKQYADDNNIKFDGPETNKIKSVSYEISGDNVIFTIITTPDFNRVKVAKSNNLSSYIAYTSKFTVNADGDYVFTLSVPAIVGTTEYAFDGRRMDTNKYTKDYSYTTVEVAEDETPAILSVTHTISDGKIIFTVITESGKFNRIKVTTADNLGGSLGVASTCIVNKDGNYVWTVKATEPSEKTNYAFDLRNSATGKYIKDYYYYEVEASTPTIISATHTVSDGKIIFTVVTKAGDYSRIKVTTADNLGGSLGVASTYTVNKDGNYVWTIKATEPSEKTTYAFDIRNATTGKYLKEYFNYEVESATPTILDVSHTVDDGKIIFTVVTKAGDFGRIKVTTADNLSGSVGVANVYTVDKDGNYVWTIKATEPSEKTIYAFDLRNATTGKYLKEYFNYEVEVKVDETPAIISVSHEISGGKIIFTVVTKAGNYDRIKATLADNLGGSIAVASSYTVDENGNYVWIIKATAPSAATNYAFDLRVAGGKYQKEYYLYQYSTASVPTEPQLKVLDIQIINMI